MRLGAVPINGPTGTANVAVAAGIGAKFPISTIGGSLNSQQTGSDILSAIGAAIGFAGSATGTAAAGNKAIVELNNPNASGVVIFVYSIDLFVPVAMAVNLLVAGTTITPATAGVNLKVGSAVGKGLTGGSNQLAPTGTLISTSPSLAANTPYVIPHDWLLALPANSNIQLQGQVVNQAFTANFRWVELLA